MSRRNGLLLILVSWWALAGCATSGSGTYLAKVNNDRITMEDLKYEFKKKHSGHAGFLSGESEIREFLGKVVDQRLLIQEAYRIGLNEDPGIQSATTEVENRKLFEYMTKKEVEEKSRATDEEVRAVYDQELGVTLQLLHIAVPTKPEAAAIRERVLSGEDFEAIIREVSIAETRKYGGRIASVTWGSLDPELERVAFHLDPGELSPVFESKTGFEILKVEERKKVDKPEFGKAEYRIRSILERRKKEARQKEFDRSLQEKYAVRWYDARLGVEDLRKAEEQNRENPLAAWNGDSIGMSFFASKLQLDRLSGIPPDEAGKVAKAILEEMVSRRLMRQEALARGYDKVPEVADDVRRFREGLMLDELYGQYILQEDTVTEAELREYFRQHGKEYVTPEKRRLAHIQVGSLDSAQDILRRCRGGESFESLALKYSEDPRSAERGGDQGWIEKKQLPLDLAQTVFSMEKGEVTGPVKTGNGHHVVKVLEIQPEKGKEFSQVREDVTEKVAQEKARERTRFWVDRLKAVSTVEINEKAIRAAKKLDTPGGGN